MDMPNGPDERASSEEVVYRRIANALQAEDIDELAAALGQAPERARHAPVSHDGGRISRRDPKNSTSVWDGLRRLTARFRSRRPA